MPNTHRIRCVGASILGWLLLLGFALFCAWQGGVSPNVRGFQYAYVAGFAGYAILAWIACTQVTFSKAAIGGWLAGAVALRIILLPTAAGDDIHRYLWEGRVQLAGFNPYSHAPDDPKLADLRTDDWPSINHPDHPAIYPPVAQLSFAAVSAIHASQTMIKAWLVLCDAATVIVLGLCLLSKGLPPVRAALYALNPLVLTAFALEAHVDSLMLLMASLSVLFCLRGRWLSAGVFFGLAVASKLVLMVWFPWWLVRHPKSAAVALGVIALTYLPYLGAGGSLLDSFVRFSGGDEFFSCFGAVGQVLGAGTLPKLVGGALLLLVVGYLAVKRREPMEFFPSAVEALLLLMPIMHYWYLSWILLWLPFRVRLRWMAASLAMVVYFEAIRHSADTGIWVMPTWSPVVVWAVFLVAWCGEIVTQHKRCRAIDKHGQTNSPRPPRREP